jgi:uncharacterized membrane protein
MTETSFALSGSTGAFMAILSMAAATYFCRVAGFWLMGQVNVTPRLSRALAALPGSIVVATVLPIALRSGVPAILAVAAAVAVMMVRRNELAALLAGLVIASAARAIGL